MTLSATYTVVRASAHDSQMDVTLPDGATSKAYVPALEVEMVPVSNPSSGTIKLVFTGADIESAKQKFTIGATIVASWGAPSV